MSRITDKDTRAALAMDLAWDKTTLQAQGRPFDLSAPPVLTTLETAYCRHYGLDFSRHMDDVTHRFGYHEVGGFNLASHYYERPEHQVMGTVLLLHGYFDHSGLYRHIIEFCLQRGYAVLIYDLPGHGLSSGKVGAIGDFQEYVGVLAHFADFVQQQTRPPYHLAGLSTGGAIIMSYLAEYGISTANCPFDSVQLLAPLVRPVQWAKLVFMHALLRPFVSSVKRKFVPSSHDDHFVEFIEHHDPLLNRRVAVSWVTALINWQNRFRNSYVDFSPVVIQGSGDQTIDWRYNLRVIQRCFNAPRIHLIPEARHHLVNEAPALRRQVFDYMARYLPAAPDAEK